jgi:hypothetical protein
LEQLENIEKRKKRRTQLEDGTNMQWAPSVRAKKRDVLTKDVVDAMVEFLTNETKVNPNKWDVMKHHIMKNRWKEHVIHFLKNQKYIFSKFLQFDSFYNCFIFCFSLLHYTWLFMGAQICGCKRHHNLETHVYNFI